MKFFTLSLLSLAFLFCSAQEESKSELIQFKYVQLPALPLAGDKICHFNLIPEYMDESGNVAVQSEIDFQDEMAEWEKHCLERDDLNTTRLKKWLKKNGDQAEVKNYFDLSKPTKVACDPKPVRISTDMIKYAPDININELSALLKLEGFELNPKKGYKFNIYISPIQISEPEEKTRMVKLPVKDKVIPVKQFYYQMSLKSPVRVELYNDDGEVLLNEIVPETNEVTKIKTKYFSKKAVFDAYWEKEKETFIKQHTSMILKPNINLAVQYVNSKHGYRKMKKTTHCYSTKELKPAYNLATEAYDLLVFDSEQAREKLGKAITKWESAYSKAKSDSIAQEGLLINLIEAQTWNNNFSKAQQNLKKLVALNPEKYKKGSKMVSKIIDNAKVRWEANDF